MVGAMSSSRSVFAIVPCVTWTTGRVPSSSCHQSGSGVSAAAVRLDGSDEVHGVGQVAARVLEPRHRELHDRVGKARRVQEERLEPFAGGVVHHVIGFALDVAEGDALRHEPEHGVAEAPADTRLREHAEAERRRVDAVESEREDPEVHYARARARGPREEREHAEEESFEQHDVGVRGDEGVVDGAQLRRCRTKEDRRHVVADAGGAGTAGAAGERGIHVAVVVVGVGGQRDELGSGVAHGLAESCAGQEANAVATGDEVPCDGEQRRHVTVHGRAADEDRRHAGTPGGCDGHPRVFTTLLG